MHVMQDLLICEGSRRTGQEEKAVEHKHMTFMEAAEVAKKADVSEMWLTHYSPSLNHPEEYMKTVTDIFPNAYPGKDGKSTELMFEGEAK